MICNGVCTPREGFQFNSGLIQFDPTHAGCLVCEQAHRQNLLLSGTVLSRARYQQ
jgi:hypothetical protein